MINTAIKNLFVSLGSTYVKTKFENLIIESLRYQGELHDKSRKDTEEFIQFLYYPKSINMKGIVNGNVEFVDTDESETFQYTENSVSSTNTLLSNGSSCKRTLRNGKLACSTVRQLLLPPIYRF